MSSTTAPGATNEISELTLSRLRILAARPEPDHEELTDIAWKNFRMTVAKCLQIADARMGVASRPEGVQIRCRGGITCLITRDVKDGRRDAIVFMVERQSKDGASEGISTKLLPLAFDPGPVAIVATEADEFRRDAYGRPVAKSAVEVVAEHILVAAAEANVS